jgi:hypothetical protein
MDPTEKTLLVLDLDETLVYSIERQLIREADMRAASYYVYFRPGLASFIQHVATLFRVAVWTSASRSYALEICSHIFSGVELEFLWASERCTIQRDWDSGSVCGAKHLRKLRRKGYSLDRILMVDDSPEKHQKNYGNLIQILPFDGDSTDVELGLLAAYLATLASCTNVRRIEKRGWRSEALALPRPGTLRDRMHPRPMVLALDLEGTLISNAVSQIPRPDLFYFLCECKQLFLRIVMFTTVPEPRFRDIATLLVQESLAPNWFSRIEYVHWHGATKDVRFVPNADALQVLLVDDFERYVHPGQESQWLQIEEFAYPYSTMDRGLVAILAQLRARVTGRFGGNS